MTPVVTTVAAVGSGLVAGIFLVFSIAVMPALRRLPPDVGIAVMQGVNRAILNPLFLLPYLGTAVACVAAAVTSGGAPPIVAGAVLYVVGAFGVTGAANVPLNNELAAVDTGPAGVRVWEKFCSRWTFWNHVRSLAALAAAVLLTA